MFHGGGRCKRGYLQLRADGVVWKAGGLPDVQYTQGVAGAPQNQPAFVVQPPLFAQLVSPALGVGSWPGFSKNSVPAFFTIPVTGPAVPQLLSKTRAGTDSAFK